MIAVWLGIGGALVLVAVALLCLGVSAAIDRRIEQAADVEQVREMARELYSDDVPAQVLYDAASDCDCDDCRRIAAFAARLLTQRAAEIASLEASWGAPAYLRSQP